MPIDFDDVLRTCAGRNTRLEGVEMLLVLEDLTGASPAVAGADARADGARLVELEQEFMRSQGHDEGALTESELRVVAEVAAACDFGEAATR